jgi:hypothetical protein
METHGYWQRQVKRMLAGELAGPGLAALHEHAKGCEECAGLIEMAAALDAAEPEPLSLADSVAIRSGVLRELRRGSTQVPEWSVWSRAIRPALAVAAAFVLLAGGFAAGRTWVPAGDRGTAALIEGIERIAGRNRTLADVENSPYALSDVSLDPLDDQRVTASFDVTRHVSVTADRSSPIVRELVVQAVLNPGGVGPRLKAIGYAADMRNDQVKDALRIAMLNDPSVPVRLRALEALAAYKGDSDVQAAFLQVLTTSDSVQMRLLAIDYLVDTRVDPAAMRDALEHLDPSTHAAALVKASAYLK